MPYGLKDIGKNLDTDGYGYRDISERKDNSIDIVNKKAPDV